MDKPQAYYIPTPHYLPDKPNVMVYISPQNDSSNITIAKSFLETENGQKFQAELEKACKDLHIFFSYHDEEAHAEYSIPSNETYATSDIGNIVQKIAKMLGAPDRARTWTFTPHDPENMSAQAAAWQQGPEVHLVVKAPLAQNMEFSDRLQSYTFRALEQWAFKRKIAMSSFHKATHPDGQVHYRATISGTTQDSSPETCIMHAETLFKKLCKYIKDAERKHQFQLPSGLPEPQPFIITPNKMRQKEEVEVEKPEHILSHIISTQNAFDSHLNERRRPSRQ